MFTHSCWVCISNIVLLLLVLFRLFFSFWIYHASGILNYDARAFSFNHLITMIYVFGLSLYLQGGALHSAR
jgi:hypothetical protein